MDQNNNRTAIIGFGCAGYHTAKGMREHGYQGEIHVYTDVEHPPANPMLTTYYVSGKLSYEEMFPMGGWDKIQSALGLTLHRNTRVTALDSATRCLTLFDGSTAQFDQVVLATGAQALIPPIEGAGDKDVFAMRTVEDAGRLLTRLEQGGIRRAVVIGASMVGIKLVELLHERDIACTLADLAPHIFPTAALPRVAGEIQRRIEKQGVELRFSSRIDSISRQDNGLSAHFSDGSQVGCDLLLLCIGTRANTQLADDGIPVNRGIVVDSSMKTSTPGIWAVGDCCEGNNLQTGQTQIIGLWDNAVRQGQTAGASIAGKSPYYPGSFNHNITHFMGMDFIGLGDNRVQGEHQVFENRRKGVYIEVVAQDNRPVCINLLDSPKSSGVLKSYLVKRFVGPGGPMGDLERSRLLGEGISASLIDYLEGLKGSCHL